MKNSKEEYIYVGIIIILIGVIIFSFFRLNFPHFKKYNALKTETKRKEKELKKRKAVIHEIKMLGLDIARIGRRFEDFNKMAFLKPDNVEVLKKITDLAKDVKIEILSFQPLEWKKVELNEFGEGGKKDRRRKKKRKSDGQKKFFLWELDLRIKAKGNYFELLKFVKKLEKAEKFIRINTLQVNKDSTTPFVHNIELKISVFSSPINYLRKGCDYKI